MVVSTAKLSFNHLVLANVNPPMANTKYWVCTTSPLEVSNCHSRFSNLASSKLQLANSYHAKTAPIIKSSWKWNQQHKEIKNGTHETLLSKEDKEYLLKLVEINFSKKKATDVASYFELSSPKERAQSTVQTLFDDTMSDTLEYSQLPSKENNGVLADAINKFRELNQLTWPQIGQIIGGSPESTVRGYSKGKRPKPDKEREIISLIFQQGEVADDQKHNPQSDECWNELAQWKNIIFFGPPGVGKSFQVNKYVDEYRKVKEKNKIRITFHPEYSYFDFVGTYKPLVGLNTQSTETAFQDCDGKSTRIPITYYGFEPGPLSKAIVKAKNNPNEDVVLIIEEINRGNCAAIFGDIFQLLDRTNIGDSEYPIEVSTELSQWLTSALNKTSTKVTTITLPSNLSILATMNTSDQGLFPMDSAFQRRWLMYYVKQKDYPSFSVPLTESDSIGVKWQHFVKCINQKIVELTQNEDKQLGPFFLSNIQEGSLLSPTVFKSKILFYLWETTPSFSKSEIFAEGIFTFHQLYSKYENGETVFNSSISFTKA